MVSNDQMIEKNLKTLTSICPICHKQVSFSIDTQIIRNSTRFPVGFLIKHCNKHLIAYIDANYHARGIHPVASSFQETNNEEPSEEYQAEPITPEFILNLPKDERIMFYCENDCSELNNEKFPNVLDKQLVGIIAKDKEISLAQIIKKAGFLEKALNRKIEKDTVLKILDKYVQKGIISKLILKVVDNQKGEQDLRLELI